jgi:hypothetical protein
MPLALAFVLALDQRIEWQLPLVLLLALVALRASPGARLHGGRAALALLAAGGYLIVNSLVSLTDPAVLASNWWAAPLRVGVFYVLLIALAAAMSARTFDADAVFRTLEWLFVLKLAVAAFETAVLLQTGEPRERPLFNIIISNDALLGVRLTSSYDVLFALFALSQRRVALRLSLLAAVLLLTETRALVLLSLLLLAWRVWRERSPWALAAGLALPALVLGGSIAALSESAGTVSRLVQLEGSSLDDKLEQIDAVRTLILSHTLPIGRGLGATVPNIVRDEARPYSYEAQGPVLLWQGGLMFFAVHLSILWAYGTRFRALAIAIVLGLSLLNPTLFALASAFLVLALGKMFPPSAPHARRTATLRHPAVHA